MKKTTGCALAAIALFASALTIGVAPMAVGGDVIVAQVDKEPPKLPEVTPGLDNPNNPAIPGNDEKGVRSDRRSTTPPDGSTAEGRSRCGTLTDTLARRRCLEDLQRERNN